MTNTKETIQSVVTKEMIKEALQRVGVTSKMILEVHSSLSSFGHVIGGARTVVDALMELMYAEGTILMPVQAIDNSEPSRWVNPPAQTSLWKTIREEMPPYDPEKTDLWKMGAVAENFRRREEVVFSNHPSLSYAAWGRYAKLLCNRQSLHFPFAEESPTARLYELKGYVLLLGTGFETATCMHLAEYRAECRPIIVEGASTIKEDGKEWRKYLNLDLDSSSFTKIGEILHKKGMVKETMLGDCRIQLFSVTDAVDEGTIYFEQTRMYDLYR